MRFKKRHAIGERAPYILIFVLLFQGSAGAVNTLGLFNYSQNIQPGTTGLANALTQVQCTTYSVGVTQAQCNPSIGNTATTQPNILTFGDWFRALTIIYQFFQGFMIIPVILGQFGLPAIFIGIFTLGATLVWLFMMIWLISGRPL